VLEWLSEKKYRVIIISDVDKRKSLNMLVGTKWSRLYRKRMEYL
jgi:hypothetical protein